MTDELELVIPGRLPSEPPPIPQLELVTDGEQLPGAVTPSPDPPPSLFKRVRMGIYHWCIKRPFQLSSLIVLMAVLASIPLLQLITLGYLFEVSGRIARTGKFRSGVFLLEQAGVIGVAAAAIFLLSLPVKLMSNFAFASHLVNPDAAQSSVLRVLGFMLALVLAAHIGFVWFRGGGFWSYFRPRPIEFLRHVFRADAWIGARDRLWDFAASMQFGSLFWLGARGMAATFVWIAIPAAILIATVRGGESGGALAAAGLGMLMMGAVLLYLPFLQVRFAAENRFGAMFDVRAVRADFRRAPLAFWIAFAATFVFAIPLYLLKIEATPEEVVWAPCILMVAFMLPARVLTGWAMARSVDAEEPEGTLHLVMRMTLRLLCVPIVIAYLIIVFFSGFTSWDGLATWFQQHALLVPVPFSSGV